MKKTILLLWFLTGFALLSSCIGQMPAMRPSNVPKPVTLVRATLSKTQLAISDVACPPVALDTPDSIYGRQGQGWVTNISSDVQGRWHIAIDLDEYESDPLNTIETGMPDIIIIGYPSVKDWSAGSAIFFSGMMQAGFSKKEPYERLLESSPVSMICHPSAPSRRRITLKKPICVLGGGDCYTDGYTIFENGRVLYTKRDWRTNQTTTKTGQLSATNFEELMNAFEQIGYLSLHDKYDNNQLSDQGSITTSITLEHQRKSIFHYYGDRAAPKELTSLEQQLEAIVTAIEYK